MRLKPKSLIVALFPALIARSALAVDLTTIYEEAVAYDSTVAAAQAASQAAAEQAIVVRANLLPDLSAIASGQHVDSENDNTPDDSWKQSEYGVNLTQPIFRADIWFAFEASKFVSEQAKALFSDAQQELIIETANVYFNVLRARDQVITTQSAEAAFKRQWEQAKERFDVGLIAITDVHEARASYDSAISSRIGAQGDLEIAYEDLARLTGKTHRDLNILAENFVISEPTPNSPDAWVRTAYDQNWSIKAAEFALAAAKENLRAEKAGHYPTLDLAASFTQSDFDGPSPLDDTQDRGVIGLQFELPIYQGGGTTASVNRARFELEQTRQNVETVRRQVALGVRSFLTAVNTDIQVVQARKQNIVSRESALEATRAGYSVGTRTIVDVLDAERNYFLALLDYANARYDYVINSLNVKRAAGTLSPQDIIDLNKWLVADTDPNQI